MSGNSKPCKYGPTCKFLNTASCHSYHPPEDFLIHRSLATVPLSSSSSRRPHHERRSHLHRTPFNLEERKSKKSTDDAQDEEFPSGTSSELLFGTHDQDQKCEQDDGNDIPDDVNNPLCAPQPRGSFQPANDVAGDDSSSDPVDRVVGDEPESSSTELLIAYQNVGPDVEKGLSFSIREAIKKGKFSGCKKNAGKEVSFKGVTFDYDPNACVFQVFGPAESKATIAFEVDSYLQATMERLLGATQYFSIGDYFATVRTGGAMIQLASQVRLFTVQTRFDSEDSFREFLRRGNSSCISFEKEIRWCSVNLFDRSPSSAALPNTSPSSSSSSSSHFSSEKKFTLKVGCPQEISESLRSFLAKHVLHVPESDIKIEQDPPKVLSTHLLHSDAPGRQPVSLPFLDNPLPLSESQVRKRINQHVPGCDAKIRYDSKYELVSLNNWYPAVSDEEIIALAASHKLEITRESVSRKSFVLEPPLVEIRFPAFEDARRFRSMIEPFISAKGSHFYSFRRKDGSRGHAQEPPRIFIDTCYTNAKLQVPCSDVSSIKSIPSDSAAALKSKDKADWIPRLGSPLAEFTLRNADKWGDFLEENVEYLKSSMALGAIIRSDPAKNEKIVTFSGSDFQMCARAAMKLAQACNYLSTKIFGQQLVFYDEISRNGVLSSMAAKLGLVAEFSSLDRKLIVYGSPLKQGDLMFQLGDLYDQDFLPRFAMVKISPATRIALRSDSTGISGLKGIEDKFSGKCLVQISGQAVTLLGKTAADMQACKDEILAFIKVLSGRDAVTAFCHACRQSDNVDIAFTHSICGHSLCADCLETKFRDTSVDFSGSVLSSKLCCPIESCHTEVHVAQISRLLDKAQLGKFLRGQFSRFIAVPENAHKFSASMCLNSTCSGVLRNQKKYQLCGECRFGMCFLCQTLDERHKGRSCTEFVRLLKDAQRMDELPGFIMKEAKRFCEESWDLSMERVAGKLSSLRIDHNPASLDDAPSWKRFLYGLHSVGIKDSADLSRALLDGRAHFGWHGTSELAFVPIAFEGFDPTYRSGQVYGPGEYFGQQAATSHGYCKGSSRMFIALLIHGPCRHEGSFAFIVNNPKNFKTSFCFPASIVSWGKSKSHSVLFNRISSQSHLGKEALPNSEKVFGTPLSDFNPVGSSSSSSLEAHKWMSPFRWRWYNDGPMQPYSEDLSKMIEQRYEEFRGDPQKCLFRSPHITRFLDDTPQQYDIQFSSNTGGASNHIQRNVKTGFVRKIDRIKMDVQADGLCWQFCNKEGDWEKYDSLTQASISQAFGAYQSGQGPAKVTLTFPGRPEMYMLDFITGFQTNLMSGEKRPFRSEKLADDDSACRLS